MEEVMDHKFKPNAHLGSVDDFKERYEYGMVAQNKFKDYLMGFSICPINSDFESFQEDMPRVDYPFPDFEFENCLMEIRRQDFYPVVKLGYDKKYNGWMYHSNLKNKTLYFCMVSKDLERIAYTNLSKNKDFVYIEENTVGDSDCCLSLKLFNINDFDIGMRQIIKIIKNEHDLKQTGLDYWMNIN